jgi:hypothetical protein
MDVPLKILKRRKLLDICNRLKFEALPPDIKLCYENFPYTMDQTDMSDDFVLGIQEFTTVLTRMYNDAGKSELANIPCVYASAILYIWWQHNVCDVEFPKGIDV